ncbi:MAG: hypothetical protein M3176_00200 [Chloroflexota bacterium]|nr:hypothetical protein [Chloroflexota bacterium]
MALLLSLVATTVSAALTVQVGRQYQRRRRPYQIVWAIAFGLFTLGVGCQTVAAFGGWSDMLYRLWYLSGAILAAAYLGQGTVYLLARRRIGHVTMVILLCASVTATILVAITPVHLAAALSDLSVSGRGMPTAVRLLTPLFNIYGTAALIGGALFSGARFLWNGGSGQRALGTTLIGVGALVVAFGGTLTRFGVPGALYVTEMASLLIIFTGFILTARPSLSPFLIPSMLRRRRRRVTITGVGLGAGTLLGAVAILPALPWMMGIVTDVKYSYTETVPAENKGAYLMTTQGVMQLYPWYVEPPTFPRDVPTLDAASVQAIALVEKQFDDLGKYHLYNLTTKEYIALSGTQRQTMHLTLNPEGRLAPGDYEFIAPTDGMFGGVTWQYFRVR